MSLNHREIDQVLTELHLEGALLQSVRQTSFHRVILGFYQPGRPFSVLIDLTPGSLRLHETWRTWPKPPKPLRFAQFIAARLLGSRVVQATQLGQDRIIKILVRREDEEGILWVRLWGGSANVLVTDGSLKILDAQYRRPGSGEAPGQIFQVPQPRPGGSEKTYNLRDLPGEGSYSQKLEAFYHASQETDPEVLKARVKKILEAELRGLETAESRALQRQAEYLKSDDQKVYGDLIMAEVHALEPGAEFLDTQDYRDGCRIRILLDPRLSGVENAQAYYKKHSKGRVGLEVVQRELAELIPALRTLQDNLQTLDTWEVETLQHFLRKKAPGKKSPQTGPVTGRPGLEFESGGFTLLVGRNAKENDELLRRWVKGKDTWFHSRHTSGGYVFVLGQKDKTLPLETLLDAGALAVHFSKARGEQTTEVYYTPVKYLRRVKDGPLGLVIPTQEKNLVIRWDPQRLQRIMKKDMQ